MVWKKQGLIFVPEGFSEWMYTHASAPVPNLISGSLYKIYFSTRDKANKSRIGYVITDLNNPSKILEISKSPVLDLGDTCLFDQDGVWPSCILNVKDKKYLYYIGWMNGSRPDLFFLFAGLAISENGGKTFERFSKVPILERNSVDPYLATSPCVIIENGTWRMWYTSGLRWEIENGKPKHYYHIKYAESKDGIDWERRGVVCIDFKSRDEYAIARPCVIKENSIYKMWYSYRGESYRIGYAESEDGIYWERKDGEVGIDVSESGWDSEMICYPCVFQHKGKKYMLYNGNSYGKTGLGYAVSMK